VYKKILVPLDGSELSKSILEHVVAIVNGCEAPQVVLLRVRDPLDQQTRDKLSADVANMLDDAYQEEAEDYLEKISVILKAKDVTTEKVVISGKPAEEIIRYAQTTGVDLIIMSTHGRSGVSRWVLGSVADKIIRHSDIPILLNHPSESS
jgi:nucleotide-binding universal stress UspA family protein